MCSEGLARLSRRLSTATADKATLTRLFSTFDLNVTRHAVARKSSKKYRHSNLLHRLATKSGELSGLTVAAPKRIQAYEQDFAEHVEGIEQGVHSGVERIDPSYGHLDY